ncbi:hypothetical protein [Citricoccus muralis]|uniref:Uncharacterized protein n=1 Tax=Citricoccus muralis TaxID=169134 RepID=A0A3D9L8X5_9MICC|nr:hypothetical protein [Citricoccus muralis]REE02300.1 hypothetical protein C8E99_0067 [Citricoccus muralis]
MSDWEFETPEDPPERNTAVEAIEARLEVSAERALLAQEAMRAAERELSSLVKEAVTTGILVPKVAALARVTTDDIHRVLEKGGLY